MKHLTDRQQEILSFIEAHIAQTGYPPTRAEICQALGFRSPNAAEEHLKALVRKGAISMVAGASRSIRLLQDHGQPSPGSTTRPTTKSSTGSAVGAASTVARQLLESLSLPLVGRVAAGAPILATEHIESHHSLDPSLFKQRPDYLLKVRGMSMRDAGILDGDLLAVKRLQGGMGQVRNGQLVVARLEDEVTVKWFQHKGHMVELLPDNPDFQPIVVDTRHQALVIEGLGVGVIRSV
ncbi:MAG TPA: transcriptional repressor LexA [Burkholderiaceae bacterium]|nr:transcriptional repressor LexA [Burkholderiaceae bacterium]